MRSRIRKACKGGTVRSGAKTIARRIIASLVVAATFSALALNTGPDSAAFAQAPEKITEVEGITEYRLDNGVKLLLFPDKSKPQFTINVTVLAGSRHEGLW